MNRNNLVEGEFKYSKPSGYCKFNDSDKGSSYEGFVDPSEGKNGFGIYKSRKGNIRYSEWASDKNIGHGVKIFVDGTRWIGDFKGSRKLNGFGIE